MSFMYASDSRITEKSLGSTSKGPRVASIGTTDKMDVEQPVIDDTLVRRMVAAQFPQWADLTVRSAAVGGRDNKTFRLGEHMIVRLPSAADYSVQVEKEHRWLPKLAPFLPLPIPAPLAMGEAAGGYPWRWSIYRWLEGDTAAPQRIGDLNAFAASLAQFLIALQRIDPKDGPRPGPHNFWRGGSLNTYNAETRQAIALLKGKINTKAATEVWETALKTTWNRPPVWIHGDVSAGNLLVKEGRLSAVIDFGMLGVGDPACDLSIAWTLFNGESREAFRAMLPLDAGTWARGRAWTLWKALIVAAGLTETNAVEGARPWRVIDEVLKGRSIDT
jgi:aminoglycoside phosphotransferase (APT) family kinase protein